MSRRFDDNNNDNDWRRHWHTLGVARPWYWYICIGRKAGV